MNERVYMLVTIVAGFALTANAMTNCTIGSKPIELGIIGKGASTVRGCGLKYPHSTQSFKFHTWGLQYFPQYHDYGFTCQDVIVVTYRKPNQPAMIWYRPRPKPEDFKTVAPMEYEQFKQSGAFQALPCSKLKVPVQNVQVWKHRALFIRLIKQVVNGIEYIRAHDCTAPGQRYHNPNKTFSWTEMHYKIDKERVSTAALNFLQGVAFANSICV